MKNVRQCFFWFVIAFLFCSPLLAEERNVRKPLVAGQFYPGTRKALESAVSGYLEQAVKEDLGGPLRALVAPHAGYIYSGPTAAYAYKQIDRPFRRVVILASNHSYDADFDGISVPEFTHYATPLGEVRVSPLAQEWLKLDRITYDAAAHTSHVIEVQLPFLQIVLPEDFEILPIITGRINWDDVHRFGELLDSLVDEDTLFIVSTDLSHYHAYDDAVKLDRMCAQALERLDTLGVVNAELCGQVAALILMEVAQNQGWQGKILDYRNSGDTAGDKNRVVGYAAIAFSAPENTDSQSDSDSTATKLNEEEQHILVRLAQETMELYVKEGNTLEPKREQFAAYPRLMEERGSFVTLKEHGQLRGCIGNILGRQPLYLSVRDNAIQAATRDPRFKPVTETELADITIGVSVLDVPRPFQVDSPDDYLEQLTHQDGVILISGNRSATYLPQVWEELPEPVEFLSHLCLKAGISTDCWRNPQTQVYTYRAQEFGEQ